MSSVATHFVRPIFKVLPGISGQVIEGTILDPSIPPRMAIHSGRGVFAMASDFRDGGAFFLTGTSFPGNAG